MLRWRFMNKAFISQNPALETNIIMEQESLSSNKIFLSDSEKDLYRQPITIEWSASQKDAENIFKAQTILKIFGIILI